MNTSGGHTLHLFVFHLSGVDCAFPLESVREVVPMARLSRPPGSPSLLAGFLDLRGEAIPVLHLDRLFDLPEQLPGLYTPLVILRNDPTAIGILAGAVREIIPVTQAAFQPLPAQSVFEDCATATIEVKGTPVYLLSPERILLRKERRILDEFQMVAQERLCRLEEHG